MSHYKVLIVLVLAAVAELRAQSTLPAASRPAEAPGFQGVWFEHVPDADDPEPVYSGGVATFPPSHVPMAVYSERAKTTFFVYGGAAEKQEKRHLQVCVSAFEHTAGRVLRPRVLIERRLASPEGNAAICLDQQDHVWVFAPGDSGEEPGVIFRSERPHDLTAFVRMTQMPFTDPQPWYLDGHGFLLLMTRAGEKGSELCFTTSKDGSRWSDPAPLTPSLRGCRALSWRHRGKLGVAFNYQPASDRLGGNPYYLETADAGRTWTTAQREKQSLPLAMESTPARVFDYASSGQAVALKDLNFDSQGNPVLLLLMSRGATSSPARGPFIWMVARWATRTWRTTGLIQSDHLLDSGCLHIEARNSWKLIAPTAPGAEPDQPGGEIVSWFTDDFGRAWSRTDLTHASDFNHNGVCRALNAQPGFYGFWADGAVRRPSASLLYFMTRDGKVFRLPTRMNREAAEPELVPTPLGATLPATQGAQ